MRILGHKTIECRCTPDLIARYQDRISGPLLDRIDMRVEVSSFTEEELTTMQDGEPTRFAAERVRKAYNQALSRQGKLNDHLQPAEIDEVCGVTGAVKQLLHAAAVRLGWSMRAYHRVLKVSRTIADLVAPVSSRHRTSPRQFSIGVRYAKFDSCASCADWEFTCRPDSVARALSSLRQHFFL